MALLVEVVVGSLEVGCGSGGGELIGSELACGELVEAVEETGSVGVCSATGADSVVDAVSVVVVDSGKVSVCVVSIGTVVSVVSVVVVVVGVAVVVVVSSVGGNGTDCWSNGCNSGPGSGRGASLDFGTKLYSSQLLGNACAAPAEITKQ